MKTPDNCRNRRDSKLIASLTPVAGPDRCLWLGRFCERLPDLAARLGMTTAEARERAGTIRTQFMKTTQQPSTP